MFIKILSMFIILTSFAFSEEKIYKPELRALGSIYTTHTSANSVYNNDTKLVGFEYRPIEDFGVYFGRFKNSFYNESYVLAVGKYIRPFENKSSFYFTLGAGFVKGYEKYNYIYDSDTKEILKKSKFATNIGKDYIVGANVGIGYDITDYLSVNISYVGAFVSTFNIKLM